MRGHLPSIAAVAVLAVGAVACATARHPPVQAAALPGKPACFFLANFQGDWTVLDDSTLIVYAPLRKDAYLIKLFAPLVGLSFHQRLGFQDIEHTGQICNGSSDDLVVLGEEPRRMPIVAVRGLTPAEQRQLLRGAGQPVPRKD